MVDAVLHNPRYRQYGGGRVKRIDPTCSLADGLLEICACKILNRFWATAPRKAFRWWCLKLVNNYGVRADE